MKLESAVAMVQDGLLSVKEACAFSNLSRSNLYVLMDRGELVFVRIGGRRLIPRKAIVELAARGLVTSAK